MSVYFKLKLEFRLYKLLFSFLMLPIFVKAEGSKEITPNMSNHSALVIMPSIGSGSYLNAPEENRIYFNINNLNERLYYGTNWYEYGTTASGGAYVGNTMYARIYGPNGVQVGGNIQLSNTGSPVATTTGHIADLTRAQNGPNIGGVSNGYNPLTFTPNTTGEHYIVFYRSTDGGASTVAATNWYKSIYFDFTVATTAGEKRAGRVFSKKWGFVAINSSLMPFAQSDVSPTFYSYSLDSTVSRITFETGFRPIAYDVAINHYGVANTGNWGTDRRSVNSSSSPSLPDGYKLFLNRPDTSIYTVPTITAQPYLADPPLVGCGAPYQLRFVMPASGDARILLDLNGVAGYQHGTVDRIIEAFNVQAGLNTILWDGLNGLGAPVASGTNIKITATYQRGRFNIPIYDAEINKNGFNVEAIAPIQTSQTRLYWDDSGLTSIGTCPATGADQTNNSTTAGINNSIVGTVSPAHAWSGNGNPTQIIPAPAVGANETNNNQCDDFGNVRTINTWGWALSVESNILSMDFFCRRISGSVYNDVNGLTNNTVDGTLIGQPSGQKLYAILINSSNQVTDSVAVKSDGTFEFAYAAFNNGNYSVLISTTPPVIGQTPPASTLPANWVNTGEYRGSAATTGDDGNINGRYSFNVNDADVTLIKYGIQQRPEAHDKTDVLQGNPGGTIQVPVDPTLFAPSDYDGGTFSKIRITAFPANATSITINGNLYTSSNFPASGIEIPTNSLGQPTQVITVDPVDGGITVSIPYRAFDNAGFESSSTGNVLLPFSILTISKKSNVEDSYNVGDTITYRIVIKNNDPFAHNNVILRDTLPAGVSFVNGSLNVSVSNPTSASSSTVSYDSGNTSYAVPNGTDSIRIQTWGGGGRGGSRTSGSSAYGGGGGGAYSESTIHAANTSYFYFVGAGSSSNSDNGGDTWFSSNNNSSGALVLAKGGSTVPNNNSNGGAGGQSSEGMGNLKFNGGNGANGSGSNGGGGGSSAGPNSNGTNASGSTGGLAPSDGGNGGNGRTVTSGNGSAGIAPGGGGGGAYRTSGSPTGGNGANGRIIITSIINGTNGSIANPPLLASNWTIKAGDSLVATYRVVVTSPSTVDSIRNTAYATTALLSKPISAFVTDYPTNTTNAVNDENSTWINTPVSGDVTTNDFDREGHTQNFGSFLNQNGSGNTISSGSTVSGTDDNGNPVANAGTLTFNPDGTYTYTPANNFVGNISVPYSICDNGLPVACDTAYLDITVSPLANIANSVIANNDEYFSYGNPVNANVFVNDRDPQGNSFTVTGIAQGNTTIPVGTPTVVSGIDENGNPVANAGTLTQNANGTMTFVPTPGFAGQVTYNYTITDNGTPVASDNATVVITVVRDQNGPLNDPPFAGDDFSYTTVNTPVNGNFSGNDSDPNNDPISIKDVNGNPVTIVPGGPRTPVNTLPTAQGGSVEFFSDGTYTYTPPTGYIGPDRVVYEICDVTVIQPQPLCAKATIHLLVGTGYSVKGNVWNDGNGMTDNLVNASNGAPNVTTYAILTDTDGNVIQSVLVNTDGTYEFTNVPGGVELLVLVDTVSRAKDAVVTVSSLPTGWVHTGENIGTEQGRDNLTNGISAVIPALTGDVENVNFGIQRIPVADAKLYNIANVAFSARTSTDPLYPNEPGFEKFYLITTASEFLTGNGLGGLLTGVDAEDCPTALDCNIGKRFQFGTPLPSTVVYYNYGGETAIRRLEPGDFIPDYDPENLIIVAREGSGMSDDPVGFTYSLVDNAGFASSQVSYTIITESALPVELLYFNAKASNCNVILNWATASELNNDYFEVQSSTNAVNWNKVERVLGNGTSNSKHIYSAVDENPTTGINYYRLIQVDFDGSVETHKTITINLNTCNLSKIDIYPVPTRDVLNIELNISNRSKLNLNIYDATGKIIKTISQPNNIERMDVSNLPVGTYFIQTFDDLEFISTKTFIIIH